MSEENVKIVDNGNGVKTVSVFSSPVRYIDEVGNWRDIDNNIYPNTSAYPVVYKYTTKANTFTIGFKETANAADFIRFVFARGTKGSISLTLNGLYYFDPTTNQKALIAAPSDAVGQVSGEKITYTNAFPGVALEFTVLSDRLKDNVILSESLTALLPDPATLGMNPATSNLVVSYTMNSKYGEQAVEKLAFLGSDGQEYIWPEPVTAQDVEGTDLTPFEQYNPATKEFSFGIPYVTTQTAAYPIEIDPTLYVASGTHEGWMRKTYAGAYARYTSQSTCRAGADNSYLYRYYVRFDLSTYANQTIYGAGLMYYPTAAGSLQWSLDHIPDFGTLDATAADWDLVPIGTYNGIGQAINTYNMAYAKSILLSRGGWAAFRIRATNEPTTASGGTVGSINGYGASLKSALGFGAYSTFTQDAPTAGGGSVTVNWTNGGGLVAGDKHRIYYKAGTGLSIDTIIANNTYVETSAYTDASSTVPNLNPGTNYCFVVVDLQEVGGLFYTGARSGVQEATPTTAGTSAIAYADTKRKITKTATANIDTRRRISKLSVALSDTRRKITMTGTALADSFRKLRRTGTAPADTVRKNRAQVSSTSDTRRRVTKVAQAVGDSVRKVQAQATVTVDTLRNLLYVVFQVIYADTRRVVRITAGVTGDTYRKVRAQAETQADTVRKTILTVFATSDTFRKVALIAQALPDAYRKVQAQAVVTIDTNRMLQFIITFVADAYRKVTGTDQVVGDTFRKTRATATAQADTSRKLAAIASAVSDTLREVVLVATARINLDTLRKICRSETAQADTFRKTLTNAVVNSDTYRKTLRSIQGVFDTYRKTGVNIATQADTYRKTLAQAVTQADGYRKVRITALATADTARNILVISVGFATVDTVRRIRKAVQSTADTRRRLSLNIVALADAYRKVAGTATANLDTYRKVSSLSQAYADTRRKTQTVIVALIDTSRNVVLQYIATIIVDTVRNVVLKLMRRAPDYEVAELLDHYEANEIKDRYQPVEMGDKYEVREDGTDMKTFTLGEKKEVGVEISSTDGTAFLVTAATYVYKDGYTVLASGGATVEDTKVFILLEPETASYTQKVVFTMTLQPLDGNGNPDLTRNQETIKASVGLSVIE